MVAYEDGVHGPASASSHNQPPWSGYSFADLGGYVLGSIVDYPKDLTEAPVAHSRATAGYELEDTVIGLGPDCYSAQPIDYAAGSATTDGYHSSFLGTTVSYVKGVLSGSGARNGVVAPLTSEIAKTISAYGLAPQHETSIAASHLPQAEQDLINNFEKVVAGLDITSLMVPQDGQAVSHPESFKFIPIVNRNNESTLDSSGCVGPGTPGIRCTYGSYESGHPYLDTRQAIGLVKGDHLIAVAGAGVDEDGRII